MIRPKETTVGELSLPPQAAFPYEGGMQAHIAAFFRHHMYGDPAPRTIGSDGATVHILPNSRYSARTHSRSLIAFRMFG